ncbi:MAG: hypothetical protein A2Z20_02810 [Bdellovibrionales bacterium RBG_16_40_8]|nr:MAG: hypothetical protein A2Z20_02810 [Bdellovibrionales bacterium RBG_16_40_8]
MKVKAKLPQKGGAKKASEIFESGRKQVPSDRLVKIISEIPEVESEEPRKRDRVAKDVEI